MTTKSNQGVTFMSASQKYSNSGNGSRKFDITVEVELTGECKVKEFRNGVMFLKENVSSGNANFHREDMNNNFSFSSNGFSKEQIKEALEEAFSFMDAVEENLKSEE